MNWDNDRQNTSWLLVLAEIVISSSVARHGDYSDEAEEKREDQGNMKLQMRTVLLQNISAPDLPFFAYLCAHRLGLFFFSTPVVSRQ